MPNHDRFECQTAIDSDAILQPHYPEIWLRIDQGSAPSVSVTGARNDKDKERILSLLEEIWQDDSWLPAA
ncbi:DinI-like family protein [Escherichia coli]|nr:DinI-like family protein [Escherichia coli]